MNYSEAIAYITSKENFYIDLGLDRIKQALKLLGNPQNNLNFIHVAGTNGKGSVCAMLDSILCQAGYKTGLYTSPHIWNYTERIKINGIDISQEKFAEFVEKISKIGIHLTEFEILTIVAFLYFSENKADIVILETGLGGRLDATNIIDKNLCSIITHIDLDHTDRLGDTIEKIASEKAGIIKPNCPVITNMKLDAIKIKANELGAKIIFPQNEIPSKYIDALSLKGEHQKENLALVLTTIRYLVNDISENIILQGLKNVKHPCRFEFFKNKNLIIDASHNPNGIEALRKNLDTYFPNQKRRFIFGCLKTKDYHKMMNILFRESDEIYLNEFNYPLACTYQELSQHCPFKNKKYSSNVQLTSDKLNIICGSFYMINQLEVLNFLK